MKTEELFERGITPKKGPNAGKKFEVSSIERDAVCARDPEGNRHKFEHGSYELWRPPVSLFHNDGSVKPTWGNLKRAMEESGLSDDTVFITDPTVYDPFSLIAPCRDGARFVIVRYTRDGKDETRIMVY